MPLSYSGAFGVRTNSPGVGGTRPCRVKVRLAQISLKKVWVEALQVLSRNPRIIRLWSALPSDQEALIVMALGRDGLIVQDTLDPFSSLRPNLFVDTLG